MFCGSINVRANKFRRRISWESKEFTYFHCRHCRGYSLYPLLSEVELENLYSKDYETSNEISTLDNSDYLINHGYPFSFSYLQENFIPGSLICDFGCGLNDSLRDFLRNLDARYYGIEYEQTVIDELAKKLPRDNFLSPSQFANLEVKFDYIFLGDVLEHVSTPSQLLQNICQKLKPNGEIILQGPLENSSSFLHSFVKLKSFLIGARASRQRPYHVSLASRKSILELIKRNNLELLHWQTFEVPWPINLDSPMKSSGQSNFLILAKRLDLKIQGLRKKSGNRFFAVVKSGNFNY